MMLGAVAVAAAATVAAASVQTPQGSAARTAQTPTAAASSQPASAAFLKEAAQGGMAEVQLAEVAERSASSEDVKALARKIREDHTQANQELQQIATSKHVSLPTDIGATHRAVEARLQKMTGASFDRAYVNQMVQDHRKDIAAFKQHQNDKDSDVKTFVTKTLPTLQDHLQRAEQVQRTLTSARQTPMSGSTSSSSPAGR
jgi:putative membrane protein